MEEVKAKELDDMVIMVQSPLNVNGNDKKHQ